MSYNNDLKSHKRSDKVKWVLTFIGFLLMFVLLAGLCLQLFGKGKVKPSEWFVKDEEQMEEIPDEVAFVGSNDFCISGM